MNKRPRLIRKGRFFTTEMNNERLELERDKAEVSGWRKSAGVRGRPADGDAPVLEALMRQYHLQGKSMVIVGGTAGIGLELARAASALGANVTIAGSRPSNVETALGSLDRDVQGETLDVRDEASVSRFLKKRGKLDFIVSTVGSTGKGGLLQEIKREEAEELFAVKYWGQFYLAMHAQEHLNPGGSLVLTTGIPSSRAPKGHAVHASISGALESLVKALALEFAPLRVNAVCPGMIETEKLFSELSGEARAIRLQSTDSRPLPTGRIGSTADAAKTYLYAMTHPHVTGQILVVDGGCGLL